MRGRNKHWSLLILKKNSKQSMIGYEGMCYRCVVSGNTDWAYAKPLTVEVRKLTYVRNCLSQRAESVLEQRELQGIRCCIEPCARTAARDYCSDLCDVYMRRGWSNCRLVLPQAKTSDFSSQLGGNSVDRRIHYRRCMFADFKFAPARSIYDHRRGKHFDFYPFLSQG